MSTADLLLVFGASFSKHTGITEGIPTIQVDYDPMSLAKFHSIQVRVLGEIGVSASLFNEQLNDIKRSLDVQQIVSEKWANWRKVKNERAIENKNQLTNVKVFWELNKNVPQKAIMCADVGNNAYSFGQYFECKDHRFLLSGYLGSIGFALPASIGAWAATKGKETIVAVAGDGGFGQYMAELTTLVKYNIPVKIILINNSQLAKISKEQRNSEFDVWKTTLSNPKFSDFASSCGMTGLHAETVDELEKAMQELFTIQGPALLEVITDPDKM
jgi:pyruvate oxidase